MRIIETNAMIKRFVERWGDTFDYSQTVYSRGEWIDIICRKHGKFSVEKPSRHITKKNGGCGACWSEQRIKNNRRTILSTEIFIKRCKSRHGEYEYDYTQTQYSGAHNTVKIICRIHGSFEQKALDHMNGHGCRKCSNMKSSNKLRRKQSIFVAKATQLHGNRFDYSEVEYRGSRVKITIYCKLHGCKFYQKAYCHLAGQNGCPRCNNRSGSADRWLDSFNIDLLREHKIEGTKLIVDGYDPATNTVYQFHGDYWHGNLNRFHPDDLHKQSGKTFRELHESTLAKEKQIRSLGYNLVTIWEYDWKRR